MLGDTHCQNTVFHYEIFKIMAWSILQSQLLPIKNCKLIVLHILSSFTSRNFKFMLCTFGKTLTL